MDDQLSSILMRMIRTLSESSSGEQREEQKRRLQTQFKETDAKIDQGVLAHQKDLTRIMQIYARVSTRLTTARQKIRDIQTGLKACKELLHYKRDDLKKHWIEGMEQKHVLKLLGKVQSLKDAPEKLDSLFAEERYLAASKLLLRSFDDLDGDLAPVEGLAEIRGVLEKQRDIFFKKLAADLTRNLYHALQFEVLQFYAGFPAGVGTRFGSRFRSSSQRRKKVGGSGRGNNTIAGDAAAANRSALVASHQSTPGQFAIEKLQPFMSKFIGDLKLQKLPAAAVSAEVGEITDPSVLIEFPEKAEMNGGVVHRIIIDIECLVLMDKIGAFVEQLKSDQLQELQQIVIRSTATFHEEAKDLGGGTSDANLLMSLFSAVVDQFVLSAELFNLMTSAVQASLARRNERDSNAPPTMAVRLDRVDIWSKVQTVIQLMLTDYLDFSRKAIHQPTRAQFSEPTADINSFFVRRKGARPAAKKTSLFRFDASSTAMNLNEFYKSSKNEEGSGGQATSKYDDRLICPPNPHNVTPIYSTLMELIGYIEASLDFEPGSHCALYGYLVDYIKGVFLGQIRADNSDVLNEASMNLDSWKAVSDIEALKDLNAAKPVLKSAVVVKKSVDEMASYMLSLPLYCEHFLTMICTTVKQFKEICRAAVRGLIQPDSSAGDDKDNKRRILSAYWAKEHDLAEFLKGLPSWQCLHDLSAADPVALAAGMQREISILKQNFGKLAISEAEVMLDPVRLRSLGQLHESLTWFAGNVTALANRFLAMNAKTIISGLPELEINSIHTLTALAKDFEAEADMCLLVLHLEARLHCFHYLNPLLNGPAGAGFFCGPDATDPNVEVIRLSTDILRVEETLVAVLEEAKVAYVFDGLSPLIGTLFLEMAPNVRKMNKNGVKKMCRNIFSVQHSLSTNLSSAGGHSSRDLSLETAKQYYELCHQRPQDILHNIVERGPKFSLGEYGQILRLMYRSDPHLSKDNLERDLERLEKIMKQVGVTV